MRTVRIILALAVVLLIAVPAVAQEKQKKKGKAARLSPTARALMRMERLHSAMEGMDLTAEQQEKLGKLREKLGPKMKEVFGKMRDLLTEEQRNAAEESMRKARESGKEGRQFFEAVESAIKLTDEQKEKMDKVGEELAALQKAMMKEINGILTPEQRENLKKKMQPKAKKQRKQGDKKQAK